MNATIREGHAPAVVIALEAGESLTSEAGAMMFLSGDVSMDVELKGGLVGGLKRSVLAGESLFLTRYMARGSGAVGICGAFPGSIRQHELDGEVICESTRISRISATSRSRVPGPRRWAWAGWAEARVSACSDCAARERCGCTAEATSWTSTSQMVRASSSTRAAWS
jgi:hypothetical protein